MALFRVSILPKKASSGQIANGHEGHVDHKESSDTQQHQEVGSEPFVFV